MDTKMELKAQHYVTHKWMIAFLVFVTFGNDVICQTVSSLKEDGDSTGTHKIEHIHREIDSLFWVSTSDYLNVNPSQHFLFSIKFELGSAEEIINIVPSTNMDTVFEKSIDGLRNNTRKNLFEGTGYRNTAVIVPVFIFVTDKPSYQKSLFKIKDIWNYNNANDWPANAVILPPIYEASSKSHVTLRIDESDLDNRPKSCESVSPKFSEKPTLNVNDGGGLERQP
ncbi:hypothetical protein ACFOET_17855 [Parapedobacter deserti]|uniref:Uncharacterized protein n=1 Tax=Parapedobacter deserti TaxID=1912957 RepID=A0ABV7JQU7_9SPHI